MGWHLPHQTSIKMFDKPTDQSDGDSNPLQDVPSSPGSLGGIKMTMKLTRQTPSIIKVCTAINEIQA